MSCPPPDRGALPVAPLRERNRRPTSSETLLGFCLTTLVFILFLGNLSSYGHRFVGVDFYHFWIIPTAHENGEDVRRYGEPPTRQELGEMYFQKLQHDPDWRTRTVALERRVLETTGTPFMYTFFRLFTGGPYSADFERYQTVATGLFLVAVIAFGLVWGYSWAATGALVALFCVAWEPVLSDIRVANVNRLLVCVLCAAVLLRHPRCPPMARRSVGLVLGLGVMFKPVIIGSGVMLVWLGLVERRWRDACLDALSFAGGMFGAFVIGSLYFGETAIWAMWLREIVALDDALIQVSAGNYAPLLAVTPFFGMPRAVLGICLSAAVAALFTFAWLRRPVGNVPAEDRPYCTYRRESLALVGGGILVFVFGSKLVWLHYLTLLVPAAIILLRPRVGAPRALIAQYTLSSIALFLLSMNGWMWWGVDFDVTAKQAAIILGLVLLLVATLHDELCMSRTETPHP